MAGLGPSPGGNATALNLAAATVIKDAAGTVFTVSVTVAGAVGALYDNDSTSTGNVAANLIAVVPAVVGTFALNWPCATGITYVPGAAQVASFAFS
jgi:hypothetical protein